MCPMTALFEITAVSGARVALCYSPSEHQLPTKLIKAEDNGVEHRGKLANKRTVHNILPDSDPSANSLLVVEVYTDSGNWSSYPPHKHDQDNLPAESFLEETYYHETDPPQGFVFQRVYTDDRSIDETMTAENENVVIVPAGYHPVGVPDGYTSVYLECNGGTDTGMFIVLTSVIQKFRVFNQACHCPFSSFSRFSRETLSAFGPSRFTG